MVGNQLRCAFLPSSICNTLVLVLLPQITRGDGQHRCTAPCRCECVAYREAHRDICSPTLRMVTCIVTQERYRTLMAKQLPGVSCTLLHVLPCPNFVATAVVLHCTLCQPEHIPTYPGSITQDQLKICMVQLQLPKPITECVLAASSAGSSSSTSLAAPSLTQSPESTHSTPQLQVATVSTACGEDLHIVYESARLSLAESTYFGETMSCSV